MSGSVFTTALGGDRDVLASLEPGMRGRVHSTFRSVVNVATDHPELLSLTSASVPRAPRALQVCLDRFDDAGIRVGDDVVSDGHLLRIGESFMVVVAATPVWEQSRATGTPKSTRIARLSAMLGTPQSLSGTSDFERTVAQRVETGISALRFAVLAQDSDSTRGAASSLVGLGLGLTPTGDDVLTGAAFVASHLRGPLDLVHRAVIDVVETGATNDISTTAMRCALRGRAVQPIEDLYAWLCGADTHTLNRLVTDVLAIGHTSGADLALGLLTAVRLHVEITRTRESPDSRAPASRSASLLSIAERPSGTLSSASPSGHG